MRYCVTQRETIVRKVKEILPGVARNESLPDHEVISDIGTGGTADGWIPAEFDPVVNAWDVLFAELSAICRIVKAAGIQVVFNIINLHIEVWWMSAV